MAYRKALFSAFLLILTSCTLSINLTDSTPVVEIASIQPERTAMATEDPTLAPTETSAPVLVQMVFPSPVSVGGSHACALTDTGGVKCWGNNGAGQLGIGTNKNQVDPQPIPGLNAGVRAVSAGTNHSCALMDSGVVKCWGENIYGQTGTGTMNTGRWSPEDVIGLTDGTAVAAGGFHTCALTKAGEVKCWGRNNEGQLGDGTTQDSKRPVTVKGLVGKILAISAGGEYTCALNSEGGVFCWGRGGQLGDGTLISKSGPVAVQGLSHGVKAISAGDSHTCAVTDDGGVKCWGNGFRGGVGTEDGSLITTPVDVPGLPEPIAAVSAGYLYSCGITNFGAVICWGANAQGQLGDGTDKDRSEPMLVSVIREPVVAISTGRDRVCAATAAGLVMCWGNIQKNWIGLRWRR